MSPLVVPAPIGAVVEVYPLTQLEGKAVVLGSCWLGAGIVYLVVLTRGLRQPPPELHLEEAGD